MRGLPFFGGLSTFFDNEEIGFAIIARLGAGLGDAVGDLKDRDGQRAVVEVLRMGAYETDDEIKAEVERLYDVARESLSTVWRAVEAVATALLKHEELDRDGVDAALGEIDIYMPVFAVQMAHGLLRDRIQLKPSGTSPGA